MLFYLLGGIFDLIIISAGVVVCNCCLKVPLVCVKSCVLFSVSKNPCTLKKNYVILANTMLHNCVHLKAIIWSNIAYIFVVYSINGTSR